MNEVADSSPDDGEFARLEALQRRVQAEITHFRAGDRLSREQVHDRDYDRAR